MRKCQDCSVELTEETAKFPKWQKKCEICIEKAAQKRDYKGQHRREILKNRLTKSARA